MARRRKIILALGGGGARGLAHIGVIQALEEKGYTIKAIAGTSMGSIVGALYSLGYPPQAMQEHFRRFLKSKNYRFSGFLRLSQRKVRSPLLGFAQNLKTRIVVNLAINRVSFFPIERLKKGIDYLIPDETFKDCEIPFAAVATEIKEGKTWAIQEGPLREGVMASTCLPGVFPPLPKDETFLVDGGVTDLTPVEVAKTLGPYPVCAVDVRKALPPLEEELHYLELHQRLATISTHRLAEQQLQGARWVLMPDVGAYEWFEFEKLDELVARGYQEVMEKMR